MSGNLSYAPRIYNYQLASITLNGYKDNSW